MPNYNNPPVHEVILDLQFAAAHDEVRMRSLKSLLEDLSLPKVQEQQKQQVTFQLGPSAHKQALDSSFDGWVAFSDVEDSVLRLLRSQITFHSVRTQLWPNGPYRGWPDILSTYASMSEIFRTEYVNLPLKRIGLRYLNRLAIPFGERFESWFNFFPSFPGGFEELFSFNFTSTWKNTGAHKDVGATLRLAQIDIPDEQLAASHSGVLFDVDLFNLLPEDAPDWDGILDWYDRAHEEENRVFEQFFTDYAKSTFQ